jgi:hypothetical protein
MIVSPEVRACTPHLSSEPPAPPIEVPSVSPMCVPPIKIMASAPSQAPTVMPTQITMLSVLIEALPMPPASAPMQSPTVMHTQVPVVSAPMEALLVIVVPKPAVPHCTPFVPFSAQWKPQLAGSRKDELRRLIARSAQQFESSDSWEEFLRKCRYPCGDLYPKVKHPPSTCAFVGLIVSS